MQSTAHQDRPITANQTIRFSERSQRFIIVLTSMAMNAWLILGANSGLLGQELVDFNRDVRPILSDKCFFCHGPDSEERQSDLRLDLENEAKKSVIVSGNPDESELIARIAASDPDEKMPPPESNKRLSSKEIETLTKWIRQGATYQQHWAFAPPRLPEIPVVQNKTWPRNNIDNFVLHEMEARELAPNVEAGRNELIRRVALDLTGLPPTIDELNAFLNDEQPGAYERLVDRLLASRHYGERMALNWMDAARYGDSSVMHADGPRDMWPWRDWVINAYNDNKPFDEFVVEQIAGDLIPNATLEQQIASGFNRNHASSDEGGAVPEELRVDYVVDRVKTTTNVFLGLSFECAQCHDHKYDPIPQKEYYQFFAFFNNNADPGFQNRSGNQGPLVALLTPAEQTQMRSLKKRLADLKKEFRTSPEKSEPAANWATKIQSRLDELITFDEPWVVGPLAGGNPNDIFNQKYFEPTDVAPDFSKRLDSRSWLRQEFWLDSRLEPVTSHTHSAFFVYQSIDSPGVQKLDVLFGADQPFDGIKIWLNGALVKSQRKFNKPDEHGDFTVPVSLKFRNGTNHLFVQTSTQKQHGSTRLVMRVGNEILPSSVAKALASKASSVSSVNSTSGAKLAVSAASTEASSKRPVDLPGIDTLRDYYHRHLSTESKNYIKQRKELESEIKKLVDKKPTTMIMADREVDPRPTYVLYRGEYASPIKDEIILADVPTALPALPAGAPANRLGLAQWLVEPNHPLTARVAVNRYWAMLFGRGIVETVMDFGNQGSPPTHQELLDWLAKDFSDHDWDVKRTIRQIVTSATYRQSSRAGQHLFDDALARRWLVRSPRNRLMGEFIRDQALAVSGLLVDKIGGPSVKPYQPDGLWNEVSLNKGVRFKQDHEEKLYRRSLYTYYKRSAPPPQATMFDAPTREKCTVQRAETNTPLAALVPLNDVQFVEASRALAERLSKEAGNDFDSRLDYLFQLCTSRLPTASEKTVCRRVLENQRKSFTGNPQAAEDYLSHGESKRDTLLEPVDLAAWAVVCNMILNLDEVLTR